MLRRRLNSFNNRVSDLVLGNVGVDAEPAISYDSSGKIKVSGGNVSRTILTPTGRRTPVGRSIRGRALFMRRINIHGKDCFDADSRCRSPDTRQN
jgi:hypothetical protein